MCVYARRRTDRFLRTSLQVSKSISRQPEPNEMVCVRSAGLVLFCVLTLDRCLLCDLRYKSCRQRLIVVVVVVDVVIAFLIDVHQKQSNNNNKNEDSF